MPINNNVQCLNAYDAGGNIPVEFLGGVSVAGLQQAVHCLAFEVLRGWRKYTLAEYNSLGEPEPYESIKTTIRAEALVRAMLNPACSEQIPMLTASDRDIAGAQGENYFEHGYPSLFASVSANAKRTFARTDPVVQ